MCVLLANTHRPKSNSFASEFLRKWGPEHSLPVSSRPVSLGTSFRLAHEFALLGLSVPPRSRVVTNTSSRIHPNLPALGCLNNKRSGRNWNLLRRETGSAKEKGDEKYLEESHRPYGISGTCSTRKILRRATRYESRPSLINSATIADHCFVLRCCHEMLSFSANFWHSVNRAVG